MRTRHAGLQALTLFLAGAAHAQAPDTSWVTRSALYEVFVQDFSARGDLKGVTEGLARIQSTGANVIWIMPVQPMGIEKRKEPLGSRYAIRNYLAVDSALGTAKDFKALVLAAHARGMKVILDWVPDHTAPDHPWVKEHPDYYVRDGQGQPVVPRDPEGKPTDWTDVVQLDYRNPALRSAMADAMRWWITEYGLDGFRVDAAGFVPYDFWHESLRALRAAAGRRLLFLAEWGDLALHRDGYDLTYAWDTYARLKKVWDGAPVSDFVRRELADQKATPRGGMRLRFSTNHDETAWDAPPVKRFGGPAGARAAFVAAALLPGRPLLYNGQEVESPQKLGLFQREPIAWNQPDAAAAGAFYRKVIDIARTNRNFFTKNLREIATTAAEDVISYRRGTVVVLVNTRGHETHFTIFGFQVDGARDLLSARTLHGRTVTLPAYGALVLTH